MDLLAQFIAPIAGLWVIHNAIFSSARFVNEMRETVISGLYDRKSITAEHQQAIGVDWKLCVAATVAVCLIFSVIVVATTAALSTTWLAFCIGIAIALYPFICACGFVRCSIQDWKLMSSAIENNRTRLPDSPTIDPA
jgi:hypothetical protein